MQGEAFPKNITLEASCMVYAEFWFGGSSQCHE
jgi:hypothetical protein